jgi:hypothetical protein
LTEVNVKRKKAERGELTQRHKDTKGRGEKEEID